MAIDGYILLSRSIVDSAVFQNEKWLKVWIWCLLEAGYGERTKQVKTGKGFTAVTIQRGQFVFGRNKHARDLDIHPSTLWKIIQKLKNMGNLSIISNRHYSVITVCNYETYQDSDRYKVTTKVTTKCQPSDNQVTHLKKGRKEESNTLLSKAFDRWWKISPKRNGRRIGKQEALKEFKKIPQNEWINLKKATENYNTDLNATGLNACDGFRFLKNNKWREYLIEAENTDTGKTAAQTEYEETQAYINQ